MVFPNGFIIADGDQAGGQPNCSVFKESSEIAVPNCDCSRLYSNGNRELWPPKVASFMSSFTTEFKGAGDQEARNTSDGDSAGDQRDFSVFKESLIGIPDCECSRLYDGCCLIGQDLIRSDSVGSVILRLVDPVYSTAWKQ